MTATASSLIAGISMCGFSLSCQSKALGGLILTAQSRAERGLRLRWSGVFWVGRKEKEPEVFTRVLASSYCKSQKRVQHGLKPSLESTVWWRSWSSSLASPASQFCSRNPVLAQVLHTPHHWCFLALEQLPVFVTSTCVYMLCRRCFLCTLVWEVRGSKLFIHVLLTFYCFLGICLDARRGGDTALVYVYSKFLVHLPIPTKD